MYIYEANVETSYGGRIAVFRYLYQARKYVQENDEGLDYWIDRVDVGKPSLDLFCEVINFCGGNYTLSRETVEKRIGGKA